MISVLIVDDFPLMRAALAEALRAHRALEVVGVAEDGVEALDRARVLEPDVIVLDLCMPRMGGLAALRQLSAASADTRVLVLSAVQEPEAIVDAIRAGADGFLTKDASGEEVAEAVVAIHHGAPVVSTTVTPHLVRALHHHPPGQNGNGSGLTDNELDILRLVAAGHTDHQISETLFVSPRTVQSHLTHIRTKLGIRRRAHLARWATEHRIG